MKKIRSKRGELPIGDDNELSKIDNLVLVIFQSAEDGHPNIWKIGVASEKSPEQMIGLQPEPSVSNNLFEPYVQID